MKAADILKKKGTKAKDKSGKKGGSLIDWIGSRRNAPKNAKKVVDKDDDKE